ncbi:MAG: heme exporter protein CcmB [Flavobacteriales bacterium]
MLYKEIQILLKKEIQLEFRKRTAISGVLLYVVTTIFVCYLSFNRLDSASVWNNLFWIILIFASTNAAAKSFDEERDGRHLYLYTLASPQAVVLSKILYNTALLALLALFALIVFVALLGNEPLAQTHWSVFLTALLLGTAGLGSLLTLISAISSRTGNNLGLMAILAFPVMLPLLLTLEKVTSLAIQGFGWDVTSKYLLVLLGMNALTAALSFILFPYLWRD